MWGAVLQGPNEAGVSIEAVSTDRRSRLKALLRLCVGAGTLFLLFQLVDPAELLSALKNAGGAGLAAAVVLNIATRCAAAARTWTLSVAADLPVNYSHTLQALFISNFWSIALPGVSAGSVATVWRYRGHGLSVLQSLTVLSASRVVELSAFCLLALVGLATSPGAAEGSRSWPAMLLLGIMGAVVAALVLLHQMPAPSADTASGNTKSPGLLLRAWRAGSEALGLLRTLDAGSLFKASLWAALQGLLDALTVLALAMALGIPVGIPEALWINALSYLAILLPIAVAGLGMREAAVLAALVPLGVARADALALALLMLAMTLINALVGAAVQIFSAGGSQRAVREQGEP
jgi:uncharacterized membrane protein YbhN (UPF0104 family)